MHASSAKALTVMQPMQQNCERYHASNLPKNKFCKHISFYSFLINQLKAVPQLIAEYLVLYVCCDLVVHRHTS